MIDTVKKYFDWLEAIIFDERISKKKYRKLLGRLFEKDFLCVMGMDVNRIQDGIDLRYIFCYDCGIDEWLVYGALNNKPCSVLEMMIALSKRCENMIECGDYGAGKMFWDMIQNMELCSMDDFNYNEDYVNDCVDKMIFRKYDKSGVGGLFAINDSTKDARNMEIWSQAMNYLNTIIR